MNSHRYDPSLPLTTLNYYPSPPSLIVTDNPIVVAPTSVTILWAQLEEARMGGSFTCVPYHLNKFRKK
ncbi:unnamed protein product [Lactuca virosa]|uniref:Uncharacterized protein n=1 Tax=Lactuca virosa TaxID=75947 RepID=A0AAU9MSP3_9ASTR|nr:unnamed protein product [Lactuca virosa]